MRNRSGEKDEGLRSAIIWPFLAWEGLAGIDGFCDRDLQERFQ